jgi:hypothetical protein
VAFSLCLLQGDDLFTEYLGLEYPLALEWHLYFHVWRGLISWAIANGYKSVLSTSLGYKPKLRMNQTLVALDLYILHTNPVINRLLRGVLPWLDPTSGQDALRLFPNYDDLQPDRAVRRPGIDIGVQSASPALRGVAKRADLHATSPVFNQDFSSGEGDLGTTTNDNRVFD